MIRRVILACLAIAITLIGAGSAAAVTTTVTVQNMSFVNGTQTVRLGTTVDWVFNDGGIPHTTTSNQAFWNSPAMTSGTFAVTFHSAGRFAYHCSIHSMMTGQITVGVLHTGTASTGYTLRWSNYSTTPANRRFDVQVRKPGTTTWTYLLHNTATSSTLYNPATPGTYGVRARTINVTNGQASAFSPPISLAIT